MARMKAVTSLALLLGFCLALLAPTHARADQEVTFDYFYDALAPYGTWVEVEGYGPCWSPANVDADWAPYTEGEWVYTDAGWTWDGDEEFAGIVYHYGRWIQAGSLGWCWVPGYDWAPAWVSWRDNDEYIGWAPLPPEAAWEPEQGVGIWVDEVYGIGPSFYSFCHHRDFGERHLRSVLMARTWNTAIIVQTVNITYITYTRSSHAVFCGGPGYDRACRFSNRRIPALQLTHRGDFDLHGEHGHTLLPRGQIVGNTLTVVSPRIVPSPGNTAHPPKAVKVISQSQVQHGWTGKGASGDLDSVRRNIHEQAQGRSPKTDPVKPIAQKAPPVIPPVSDGSRPLISQGITGQPIPPQAPVSIPTPVTSGQRPMKQGSSSDQIGEYLQRQRAEAEARTRVENQRAQEMLVRQQGTAEDARRKAEIQQQGRDAMDRQRQERAQMQLLAQQEQQRQRQQQQQQQLQTQQQQLQNAAMEREKERRIEEQRRTIMPPVISQQRPQIQSQPPARSDIRKSDDTDEKHKKK